MDLYWGGPERRITGLTVRIIAVNALALLILAFGILYLGQYQNNLINARLQNFQVEIELIAEALAENIEKAPAPRAHKYESARNLVIRLSLTTGKRIRLFNPDGLMVFDSMESEAFRQQEIQRRVNAATENLRSLTVLKNMARFVIDILPDRKILSDYPETDSLQAKDFPDAPIALDGDISLSIWQNKYSRVFLSAAAPLQRSGENLGAVLMTYEGKEIEDDIGAVWVNVLSIFGGTFVLTILLSIYLSGVIASPLKKLAKAAESVRKGQAGIDDIPDFSQRYDEIGELSIAFKHMTQALWERMDATEQFAADVAHELKNPLTSLRSAVETASIVKKPADRKKLMGIIEDDVKRLDRLITDISSASRLEAELSREEFAAIPLKKFLHNLLDGYADPLKRETNKPDGWHYAVAIDDKTIMVESGADQNIVIWGLESRLIQVFQNLIANALSFSPKGGAITLRVHPLRRHVSIAVEDQGPGIPESKRDEIFQRFYSERPGHEAYGTHSGLGLSICKQIIEAHGGEIYAENIKDARDKTCGARFTVLLNKA